MKGFPRLEWYAFFIFVINNIIGVVIVDLGRWYYTILLSLLAYLTTIYVIRKYIGVHYEHDK